MVFCAYCGKSFTRKEHLERHIPTHTNVKPHRCSACQLSFARRDLLQRHHSTYHEARDPMEPLPGGVPTVAGRTPIACQNCANAKTGCDKRVPCSRCAEKNLPCAPRFARRSSKAAVRAAQASAAFQSALTQQSPQHMQPQTIDPSFMEVDPSLTKAEGKSPSTIEAVITVDSHMKEGSSKKSSPANSHLSPTEFPSPHTRVDNMDDFMQMGGDFVGQESNYQDLLVWPGDYPIDLDMYQNPIALNKTDIGMNFTELSDMSASSEPMTASSSRGSIHTRGTSIMSTNDFDTTMKSGELVLAAPTDSSIPEFEVVIAAERAWNLARCNPSIHTGTCPRTAIVHLECLEQKSKQEGTWSSLEKYLEQVDWDASDLASVVPLTSRTRDKMLAITQSFLHKALEIHRGGINGYPKAGYASPGDFNFIVLPPSKILEYFLRSYVRSLSVYYPLVVAGCVDPNEMLQNNQASTLLVLLMIAQGAAAMPMAEARYLSAGLTETCRISLFDIVEKDVELSADPIALRCALLFIVLGAWSGDKWLMDIAMGQRGMYMSMLKHAGMLEPQSSMIPAFNNSTSAELQWRSWQNRESQNRLVYNYVMLDQELSLFHDTAPLLAITELQCPLPGPEVLWMAPNSERWLAAIQSVYGCTANVNPQLLNAPSITPSLSDLFQDFLHDNLSRRQSSLSPQQLRLILHPLQSLLCHLRQMLSCFSDVLSSRSRTARTLTKASTLLRLEEVQALLQKWYELTMIYHKANPNCPITRCNMVLYHLISLNAVTNFPEIERLARREGYDGSYWELSLRHKRCIYQREEAIFHCGQVFRLLRMMPNNRRPSWWSAAMYRATLILWTDSISRLDPNFQTDKRDNSVSGSSAGPVAIDQVTPEDPAVIAYLWSGDGMAVLTRLDGSTVSLEKPADVLTYAIRNIEDGFSSRIGDGIKRKLMALGSNWSVDTMGALTSCGSSS
ncbi:transcription factor Cmr1 [Bombardia bombarda]|uniref:Transcription factor Cmr1 n=1 Tax=Bombardia bombarda TaxID=252184 RepID=A0AA39WI69_9PEZI|nr:transcription factor Cmr1 [Bombardia bombarda]